MVRDLEKMKKDYLISINKNYGNIQENILIAQIHLKKMK